MNYFSGVTTVEDVKALYRKLAMKYHPDRGGDTATMQALNAQYHDALSMCHGQERQVDDQTWTYYYSYDAEQEIVEVIDATLAANILNANHNFSLIGKWLWITGDTKPIRSALKELGYRWHSKRQAWYWRANTGRKHVYNKRASLADLAAHYGASGIFVSEQENRKGELA